MRVAAAQAVAVPADIEHNVATAARLLAEAGERGVELVVFPELFLCCYDLTRIRMEPERCDLVEADPRLEPVRTACRAGSVAAVVSAAVRTDARRTISALVFDDTGTLCARYDKQHVDEDEAPLFGAGSTGCTFYLRGRRLAIGICRDARFPDHARTAARDGAEVYLCPSSHTQPLDVYPQRARENGIAVVVSNHLGEADGRRLCGHSAVYGSDGRVLADAGPAAEGLAIADVALRSESQPAAARTAHAAPSS